MDRQTHDHHHAAIVATTPPTVTTGAAASAAPEHRSTLSCPRALVGRLIGKSGTTVKGVQLFTGAVIEIDQLLDPSQIIVFGSRESVQLAESIITDIMHGRFKGFALLRQLVAAQRSADASMLPSQSRAVAREAEQYVYAPGFGLFPQRQLYTGAPSNAPSGSGGEGGGGGGGGAEKSGGVGARSSSLSSSSNNGPDRSRAPSLSLAAEGVTPATIPLLRLLAQQRSANPQAWQEQQQRDQDPRPQTIQQPCGASADATAAIATYLANAATAAATSQQGPTMRAEYASQSLHLLILLQQQQHHRQQQQVQQQQEQQQQAQQQQQQQQQHAATNRPLVLPTMATGNLYSALDGSGTTVTTVVNNTDVAGPTVADAAASTWQPAGAPRHPQPQRQGQAPALDALASSLAWMFAPALGNG